MDFWIPIIIPSAISLLGFVVTIFTTYKQFKNTKKDRIIERQSQLYIECYKNIESVVNEPYSVFDRSYYQKIALFKAEMKFIASSATLKEYKAYLEFIYNILKPYNDFMLQNDPRENKNNYEIGIREDTSEEYEICHVTEFDIEQYETKLHKYQEEHLPDMKDIKKYHSALLNSMRKDLCNDNVDSSIIE